MKPWLRDLQARLRDERRRELLQALYGAYTRRTRVTGFTDRAEALAAAAARRWRVIRRNRDGRAIRQERFGRA